VTLCGFRFFGNNRPNRRRHLSQRKQKANPSSDPQFWRFLFVWWVPSFSSLRHGDRNKIRGEAFNCLPDFMTKKTKAPAISFVCFCVLLRKSVFEREFFSDQQIFLRPANFSSDHQISLRAAKFSSDHQISLRPANFSQTSEFSSDHQISLRPANFSQTSKFFSDQRVFLRPARFSQTSAFFSDQKEKNGPLQAFEKQLFYLFLSLSILRGCVCMCQHARCIVWHKPQVKKRVIESGHHWAHIAVGVKHRDVALDDTPQDADNDEGDV